MIRLRVVGWSDDHELLLLSNKPRGKRPSHAIAIDQKLMGTLQDVVYARREAARDERRAVRDAARPPAPTSKVPPREMQRLMRAGQSAAQVARTAGVDLSYVEQFLVPVLYEREGIVRDAQALFQTKAKLGPSGLSLGEAVQHHLAARHVHLDEASFTAAWSATRRDGDPWVVTLTFPFRGRARTAKWRLDALERAVVPLNDLARDIGWVAPSRAARIARVAPSVVEVGSVAKKRKPATKRKPAARKRAVKKTPAKNRSVAKKKKAAAKKKPAARKAAAKKSAPRRAGTKPRKRAVKKTPAKNRSVARKKPVAKKRPVARKKPVTRRSAPRRRTTRR